MEWSLAHRPRNTYDHTEVTLEASSGGAAIEQLRGTLPEGELILYVREKTEPYAAGQ